VIIGRNGSGKSTILKLIARVYEPTEGDILIDGRDIKALRLADLRNAMSVLFQDYTHFPLSVRELAQLQLFASKSTESNRSQKILASGIPQTQMTKTKYTKLRN
jgi:ABC-type multidrug transport system fused ATPase/permease subunit